MVSAVCVLSKGLSGITVCLSLKTEKEKSTGWSVGDLSGRNDIKSAHAIHRMDIHPVDIQSLPIQSLYIQSLYIQSLHIQKPFESLPVDFKTISLAWIAARRQAARFIWTASYVRQREDV